MELGKIDQKVTTSREETQGFEIEEGSRNCPSYCQKEKKNEGP